MKIKNLAKYTASLLMLFTFLSIPLKSYAATDSYTLDLTWDQSSCTGYFSTDGYSGLTVGIKNNFYITQGDTLNVSIVNQASQALVYNVDNGQTVLASDVAIGAGATVNLSYSNVQGAYSIMAASDPSSNVCAYKVDAAAVNFISEAPAQPPAATPASTTPSSTSSKPATTTPTPATTSTPTTTTPASTSTTATNNASAAAVSSKNANVTLTGKKSNTKAYIGYLILLVLIAGAATLYMRKYMDKTGKGKGKPKSKSKGLKLFKK